MNRSMQYCVHGHFGSIDDPVCHVVGDFVGDFVGDIQVLIVVVPHVS